MGYGSNTGGVNVIYARLAQSVEHQTFMADTK